MPRRKLNQQRNESVREQTPAEMVESLTEAAGVKQPQHLINKQKFVDRIDEWGFDGVYFQREFKFDEERNWRFDFAFPLAKVAVEVEGATWTGGRHTRGSGFEKDAEKYNTAASRGWLVLRATTTMLPSDDFACFLFDALVHRQAITLWYAGLNHHVEGTGVLQGE